MKINRLIFTISIFLFALTNAFAQNTYVPDDNFEQALIDLGYDSGSLNDSVPTANIDTITKLEVIGKDIYALAGIEDFIKLNELHCFDNKLTTIDISHNKMLEVLNCGNNQFTTLNLKDNTELAYLRCQQNKLTELDLSSNIKLIDLSCDNNNLANLDLSANAALMYLNCAGNRLTGLNLQNENNNKLYVIDATNNSYLFCIQVDDAAASESYANWHKDYQANYSEDCGPAYAGSGIPLSEYNCLVDLYNSANGENWTNNTNWLDTINYTVADWAGISVKDNHVSEIVMDSNNVVGVLPAAIEDLQYLEMLALVNNNISGSIPSGIGNMQKLRTISLRNNNLTGEIPASIGQLDSLEVLGIDRNNLEGAIPVELGDNTMLEAVYLAQNNLSGEIPSSLGNLSKLRHLNLSHNALTGKIPSSLGNLTELRTFNLSNNLLMGPLPVELQNLTKVYRFDIDNNLIGELNITTSSLLTKNGNIDNNRQIPDELAELIQMDTLKLGGNKLQFNDIEPIFSWNNYKDFKEFIYSPQAAIGLIKNIEKNEGEDVSLSIDNYFPGPSDTYQWYKNNSAISGATNVTLELSNLQLSDAGTYICKISNPVAHELTLSSGEINLHIAGGSSGETTGAGVPLSEYEALVEIFNNTNGSNWTNNTNWLDTINYTVADWAGISVKDNHVSEIVMDSNNVVGVLPAAIEDLQYLEMLALVNNNISGSIPSGIGNMQKLRTISLRNNNLTGEIPASIGQLDSLEVLGIDRNNLEGAIPVELGDNTMLEAVYLAQNNLSGEIPSSLGNLSKLRHLNLSHNALTGKIPSSLGNLTELRTFNLSNNLLMGPLPVELQNLTKVYRFDIDNNLIGELNITTSSLLTKNGNIDNNRQIPDELAELIQMDTLKLGGNKLQFNDIEPIFSWNNYKDFKEFIYSPQAAIGLTKNIEKNEGEDVSLSIDNYFPGPSDTYQWYKNNSAISGATNVTLKLSNLQLSDAGTYICKISNPVAHELTLSSGEINLHIAGGSSGETTGAGVPLSEYEALVEIYNNTNGTGWANSENWLDTINHSVNEWYGITVENNHVTGFMMPNNNLSKIPVSLNDFPELSTINLSDGNFSGNIPDFGNLTKLNALNLSGNKFTFKDLAAITNWNNYTNFEINFNYSPQANVGIAETLFFEIGDTMKFRVKNYNPDINDHFEWYRNQASIPQSDNEQLTRIAIADDYSAMFYCKISNPTLTGLTLQSELIQIIVTNDSADSLLLFQIKQEYPQLQEIWDDDNVSNWSRVTFENGKVTALDLSGLNLEGDISPYFADFDSLKWLDLSNNNFSGPITSLLKKSALKNSIISEESTLEYLNIANNKFTFSNLEPTAAELNSINEFNYSPQSVIGNFIDTIVIKNQNIELTIENYAPGEFDEYTWYKDGSVLSNSSQLNLFIENAALTDSGKYTCQVKNSLFPDLTLFSDTVKLSVLIPDGIEDFDQDILIYPNPAKQKIYVKTGNKLVNIKIFDLNGILIQEKKSFHSGWIKIQTFAPGIYFFRIEIENSEIINKKIILK